MPQQIIYTITTSLSHANFAVSRFRINGLIAGKADLQVQGYPGHIYIAAGNWLEDEDHDDDQFKDVEQMDAQPKDDPIYFDMTWDEKRYVCSWIRREYPPFVGNRSNGPRDITPIEIWKKIGEYYDNPDNAIWTYIPIRHFFTNEF